MAVWNEVSIRHLPFLRFDPEYYQPHYLKAIEQLKAFNAIPIGRFADVTDGIHGSPEWVDDGGVRYLSAKSVKDNYFVLANAGQISQEQDTANPRTRARINDVLITTVGTIGNAAVVYDEVLPANMDRHLGIIRIRPDRTDIDPYYLSTFLNCRFGRLQSLREATGNVQLNLFIEKINTLLVPLGEQCKAIGETSRAAYAKRKDAERIYAEAENLLLNELGLDALDLSHDLTYERNFSEVAAAGRYDARYFAPRYQRAMKIMARSGQTLGSVAPLAKRFFRPIADEPFNYIEIGNLADSGHAESEVVMGIDAPSRAQLVVGAGDVITSTVRPIRRLTALIEPEQHGFVCSSGFAVLEPRDIAPELLTVYLRLPIVSEVLDLHTTATMYPAIATDVLLNIPISQPSESATTEIVNKVQQSRQAREQAKQLLEDAKQRVEHMILGEEASHVA